MYVTSSPPSSSRRLASGSPSKRTQPVRVVFENRELVLADDLDEARATLGRQRPPARILERRDRVQERRPLAPAAELHVECVRIETFLVHLERDDLDPVSREDLERTVVGRRLHEHTTRHARELLCGVEDESLEPADREHDALRRRRRAAPRSTPGAARSPRRGHTRRPLRRRAAPPRMRTRRAPRPGSARAQALHERRKSASLAPHEPSGRSSRRDREAVALRVLRERDSHVRSSCALEVGVVVGVGRDAAAEEPGASGSARSAGAMRPAG